MSRSLAKHLPVVSSRTIGVVVPHRAQLSSHYYSQVLQGVSDAMSRDRAYRLKLLKLKPVTLRRGRLDVAAGLDGLIVTQWQTLFDDPGIFRRLPVPCAVIGHGTARWPAHCISADDERGGRLAAQHLYARGHRRIAIIAGPRDATDSRLRVHGFLAYLKRRGVSVPSARIVHGEFHEQPTVPLATALLRTHGRKISAIFCCNDNMAFGVLRACRRLGWSCPDDISVMGYDGDPRGEHASPPLTTIRVPIRAMARRVTRTLLRYLQHGRRREFLHPTLVSVTVIPRRSVSHNPAAVHCDRRCGMI